MDRLTRVLLLILVPCAVLMTALVAWRELAPRRSDPGSRLPSHVRDWRALAKGGHRIGNETAAVTIVEFADFECPFCGEFYGMFKSLHETYRDSLALVYRHFPLPIHPNAFPAAIASECAGAQGHFEAMYDVLFAAQGALGQRTMQAYAVIAGVPDTAAFSRCLQSDSIAAVVQEDRQTIENLGSNGTPTLIINGEVVQGAPAIAELRRVIDSHLRDSR